MIRRTRNKGNQSKRKARESVDEEETEQEEKVQSYRLDMERDKRR